MIQISQINLEQRFPKSMRSPNAVNMQELYPSADSKHQSKKFISEKSPFKSSLPSEVLNNFIP